MQLQLIFLLAMSLLLVIFTIQNPHPVPMHFMGWGGTQVPLIVVIIVSVLMGAIVSGILGLKREIELRKIIRELKYELDGSKTPSSQSMDEDEDELKF